MGCDIWIENLAIFGISTLSSTRQLRSGQKIVVPNKQICKVGLYLHKTGSPTGTAYCRIRKVSDDSIIATSTDTLDVSTLTGAFVWYCFDFPNVVVNEEVRILLEYSGGDNNNYVRMSISLNLIIGVLTYYKVAWVDNATYDTTIKIYEYVGIPDVTTGDVTDGTGTSGNFHGEVTDVGDSPVDERGWEWGTTIGGPYPNSWTETGTFTAEEFSHVITGLTQNTCYYFRAKAHNAQGWGYGVEKRYCTPYGGDKYLSLRLDWDSRTRSAIDWRVGIKMKYNDVEFLRSLQWTAISGDFPRDTGLGYNEQECNGWVFPVKNGYVIFLKREQSTSMIAVSYDVGVTVLIRVLKAAVTLTFPKLSSLDNLVTTGTEAATSVDLDEGEYALFYNGSVPSLGTYLYTDRSPYDVQNGLTYQIRFKHLGMTGGGIDENIITIGSGIGNNYTLYFHNMNPGTTLEGFGFLPFVEDYNYCNVGAVETRAYPTCVNNYCFVLAKAKWHTHQKYYVCGSRRSDPYSRPYVFDEYTDGNSITHCFLGNYEDYYHVGHISIAVAKDEMLNWRQTITAELNIDSVNRIADIKGKVYLYVFRPLKMGHESGNSVGFMLYIRGDTAVTMADVRRWNGVWNIWNPAPAGYLYAKPFWGMYGEGTYGNAYGMTLSISHMFKGHYANVTPEIFVWGGGGNVHWLGILTDETDCNIVPGCMTRKNVYGYFYRRHVEKDRTVPAYNPPVAIDELVNTERSIINSYFPNLEYPTYTFSNDGDFIYKCEIRIAGQFEDEESGFSVPIKIYKGSGTNGTEAHPLVPDLTMVKAYFSRIEDDFSDIVFVNKQGTILPFGLERRVNENYAIFWIKIPFVPRSDESTFVYLYAGDPTKDYSGNEDMDIGVFFYDPFETPVIDGTKWTETLTPTITTTEKFEGKQSIEIDAQNEYLTNKDEVVELYNIRSVVAFKPHSSANKLASFFELATTIGLGIRGTTDANNYVREKVGGFESTPVALDYNEFAVFTILTHKGDCEYKFYIGSVEEPATVYFELTSGTITLGNGDEAAPHTYFDYILQFKTMDDNPICSISCIEEEIEEVEVGLNAITDAITDWVYDYDFRYEPSEMIRASLINRIEETKRIIGRIASKLFGETKRIKSRVGKERFEETKPISSSIIIKFAETSPVVGNIIKKFEESQPILSAFLMRFTQRKGVHGVTKSDEENKLEQIKELERDD